MTVKHVRAASVPPAMSRNSVTGAAPVKSSLSAKSAAMLTREHITTRACLRGSKECLDGSKLK